MFNYFFELRNRLVYIFSTLIFLSVLSFNYREALLFLIVQSSLFTYETNLPYFIYTDLTEILFTYIKLAVTMSTYVCVPFIIRHLWDFLKPGLYKVEYLYLKHTMHTFYIIWVISLLVVHYFLLPQLWQFFSGFDINTFQGPLGLHFEAKLNEFLNFLLSMYFYCCFGLQFFISFVLFTISINVHNLIFIKKSRRYIYLISFLIAALVTPPDALSQLLVAFFISFIYEILTIFLLVKNEYIEIIQLKKMQTITCLDITVLKTNSSL
jgi:sec-independent protein translocase protein TatC